MGLSSGTTAFLSSLGLVAVSIFFFLQDQEDIARLFLVLAAYVFVLLFFLLKALYYTRHGATFNVFVFVVLLPLSPIALIAIQNILLTSVMQEDMLILTMNLQLRWINESLELLTLAIEVLLLPIYYFSLFLVLRTHLRYPVIRLQGHSIRGLSPRFSGFLLTILIPLAFVILAVIYSNLLFLIFGITFFLTSASGIFV